MSWMNDYLPQQEQLDKISQQIRQFRNRISMQEIPDFKVYIKLRDCITFNDCLMSYYICVLLFVLLSFICRFPALCMICIINYSQSQAFDNIFFVLDVGPGSSDLHLMLHYE